jgi:hypothetical protein
MISAVSFCGYKKGDTNDEGLMVMCTLFEAYIIMVYIDTKPHYYHGCSLFQVKQAATSPLQYNHEHLQW